jgi:hypothetical protein
MKASVDRFVMGVIVAVILAGFFLPACCKPCAYPPEPPVVVIDVDGGNALTDAGEYQEPFDTAGAYLVPACASACSTLRRVGCEDGFSRPGEDTCYIVCKRAQLSGVMDFKPACVTAATSKEAVRACGTYRCLR